MSVKAGNWEGVAGFSWPTGAVLTPGPIPVRSGRSWRLRSSRLEPAGADDQTAVSVSFDNRVSNGYSIPVGQGFIPQSQRVNESKQLSSSNRTVIALFMEWPVGMNGPLKSEKLGIQSTNKIRSG
jgi:hypothetical protein